MAELEQRQTRLLEGIAKLEQQVSALAPAAAKVCAVDAVQKIKYVVIMKMK